MLPHVALALVRRPLDAGLSDPAALEQLDWCEIALEVCRQKRNQGQVMKNLPGLLIKIVKDEPTRQKAVSAELAESLLHKYREMEAAALRQADEEEEREYVAQYEQYRQRMARRILSEMSTEARQALCKQQSGLSGEQERLERLPADQRLRESEQLALHEIAKREAPPFDKWILRVKARQALLPFAATEESLPA